MSQAGSLNNGGGGGGSNVQTLTGNSGGAVGPTGNNINIVGTGSIAVAGNPGTSTLTISSSAGSGIVTLDADSGSATGSTVTISGGTTGLTTTASSATMDLTGTLALANGGTSASLTASNGGIFYSTASAGAILAGTSTADQVLLSGSSTTPAWSTATYPATATANEILYASSSNVIGQITTANNGVLITSNSGVPSLLANSGTPGYVLTANSGAPPSWQAGGSGGITTIDGDSGSVTGSTITIYADRSGNNCGSSVEFVNSGTTSTLNVTDGSLNTLIGQNCGNLSTGGSTNNGFGNGCLNSLTSGSANMAMGRNALKSITTGNSNIAIGNNSGNNYTSSETGNILVGNTGILGESDVIRIGTGGTQSACYVAGITGSTPTSGNTPQVTLCDNAGNLTVISSGTSGFVLTSNGSATPSFQAASGGSGITTINGDTGSVTGATVTIEAGVSTQNCGSSVSFDGSGTTLTMSVTDSNFNTIVGANSGTGSGTANTVFGRGSCLALTSSAQNNSVLGYNSGQGITDGTGNCLFGDGVANSLTTGIENIIIGHTAGGNYTSSESTNILLYHTGTVGESGAIHIGISPIHSSCSIAGIAGVTVASSAAVLINTSTGQLGTVVSSARFKDDIKSIEATDRLLQLNPVTFTYKAEKEKITHYGLIAEEVEKVLPELVVYGSDGLPETVKYHEMPALLLAEIKKLRAEVNELKARLS